MKKNKVVLTCILHKLSKVKGNKRGITLTSRSITRDTGGAARVNRKEEVAPLFFQVSSHPWCSVACTSSTSCFFNVFCLFLFLPYLKCVSACLLNVKWFFLINKMDKILIRSGSKNRRAVPQLLEGNEEHSKILFFIFTALKNLHSLLFDFKMLSNKCTIF